MSDNIKIWARPIPKESSNSYRGWCAVHIMYSKMSSCGEISGGIFKEVSFKFLFTVFLTPDGPFFCDGCAIANGNFAASPGGNQA